MGKFYVYYVCIFFMMAVLCPGGVTFEGQSDGAWYS